MSKQDSSEAPNAARFVTENIDRILAGVSAALSPDGGETHVPFIMLLPREDGGTHMMSNLPEGEQLRVMHATLAERLACALREALTAGRVSVIALSADESNADDDEAPKVH